jgi:hypothetical protein
MRHSSCRQPLMLLSLLALLIPLHAFAYHSTLDTGEVIAPGQYRVGSEVQFLTSGDNGANVVGRFDWGHNDESSFRGVLGVGAVNFQSGFYYKLIPFPDYKNQPAIGFLAGIHYARDNREDDVGVRFHPLISKRFNSEIGEITPYASIPLGLHSIGGDLELPIQLALGVEVKPEGLKHFRFMTEFGFNLHKASGYISVNAALDIDNEKGVEFN